MFKNLLMPGLFMYLKFLWTLTVMLALLPQEQENQHYGVATSETMSLKRFWKRFLSSQKHYQLLQQ